MLNEHIIDAVMQREHERELEELLTAKDYVDGVIEVQASLNNINAEIEATNRTWTQKAQTLLYSSRNSANRRQFECELTIDWILDRIKDGVCERTGIPFHCILAKGEGKHPYSPSIDRIDSSKGYTLENSQVVVMIYNYLKNDFSQAQVNEFMGLVVKNNA